MSSHFLGLIARSVLVFFDAVLLLAQNDPVVLVVVLVAVALEEVLEHVPHSGVLGSLVEAEVPALAEVLDELDGVALAEHLDGGGQLLLLDALVLVPLVVGLETLPGQHPPKEVHSDVADALHVVTTGLLDAEVGVDGGVSGSASEVLALPVGDVLAVPLDVALGQSEVDEEDLVRGLVEADAEVVGLDVPVDEVAVVDVLDPGDHLVD